jgi:hypothetical protein
MVWFGMQLKRNFTWCSIWLSEKSGHYRVTWYDVACTCYDTSPGAASDYQRRVDTTVSHDMMWHARAMTLHLVQHLIIWVEWTLSLYRISSLA